LEHPRRHADELAARPAEVNGTGERSKSKRQNPRKRQRAKFKDQKLKIQGNIKVQRPKIWDLEFPWILAFDF
jgi:hypothetical protein